MMRCTCARSASPGTSTFRPNCCSSLAHERLLHGEARTQQPQHLHTGCARRTDRVGYVHKRIDTAAAT
jgi:hypothetical protein